MSWFRKDNKVLIPPVAEPTNTSSRRDGSGPGGRPDPSQQQPGSRFQHYPASNATYIPSRDRDLYSSSPAAPSPSAAMPPRRQIGTDPYALKGRHPDGVEQDRAALLGGYKPAAPQPGRANSGSYGGGVDDDGERQEQEVMDEDEEVEGIKKDMRWTKQETVSSSRNALRLAREAEEVGRSTLLKLGDQSEKLADTKRHLDLAKAHTTRAEDSTNELKQLNKSIFRPVITFNKKAKRAAEEARIEARHAEEREEREKAMADVRETEMRIGKASTYGLPSEEEIARKANRVRGEGRKKFQFEATESDEELEDELDDNLGEIGDIAKRLKAIAMAQGSEIESQNGRLDILSTHTETLNGKIDRGTERLKKIK